MLLLADAGTLALDLSCVSDLFADAVQACNDAGSSSGSDEDSSQSHLLTPLPAGPTATLVSAKSDGPNNPASSLMSLTSAPSPTGSSSDKSTQNHSGDVTSNPPTSSSGGEAANTSEGSDLNGSVRAVLRNIHNIEDAQTALASKQALMSLNFVLHSPRSFRLSFCSARSQTLDTFIYYVFADNPAFGVLAMAMIFNQLETLGASVKALHDQRIEDANARGQGLMNNAAFVLPQNTLEMQFPRKNLQELDELNAKMVDDVKRNAVRDYLVTRGAASDHKLVHDNLGFFISQRCARYTNWEGSRFALRDVEDKINEEVRCDHKAKFPHRYPHIVTCVTEAALARVARGDVKDPKMTVEAAHSSIKSFFHASTDRDSSSPFSAASRKRKKTSETPSA